jgi:tetratricopeptide (TPR) repeat protein
LGLYRKSIKSCEAALILDQNALQAYKIWGKALVGLGRKYEAVNIWETALKCIDSKGYDILLAKDIYELVKQNSDTATQESDLENELTALKLEGKAAVRFKNIFSKINLMFKPFFSPKFDLFSKDRVVRSATLLLALL